MYIWLRPSVKIYYSDGTLVLIGAAGEVIELSDPSGAAKKLALQLDGQSDEEELSHNPYYAILEPVLAEKNWLVRLRAPLNNLIDAYPDLSREISYFSHLHPNDVDTKFSSLSAKTVLVVGVGGIGTNVAFGLCACGVGKLIVVDPDTVEPTNFNRQFLYSYRDIGRPKVHALQQELGERFRGSEIQAVHQDFDQVELAQPLIEESDLIVICGESTIINDEPWLCAQTPLMMSGYEGADGIVGPLIDPAFGTACWSCMMNRHDRDAMKILEESSIARKPSWNPSGYPINSMTGAACVNICVRYLSNQPDVKDFVGVRWRISMDSFELNGGKVTPGTCPHSLTI